MKNRITFTLPNRASDGRWYTVYICLNGRTTGYTGTGTTPAKAKADARRKLKKLGRL